MTTAISSGTDVVTSGAAGEAGGSGRLRAILPGLLLDVVVPTGAYYLLHSLGASDVLALAAGGVVSGLVLVAGVVRSRRVDAVAGLMLGLFAVGLLALLVTGDARFMLAKDSFGTGVAGLVFLGSLLFSRPVMFLFARKTVAGGEPVRRAAFEAKFASSPGMRRTFRMLTVLWGGGLLVEALVRIVLVYTLPVNVMVAGSGVIGGVTVGLLMVVTALTVKRAKQRAAAR